MPGPLIRNKSFVGKVIPTVISRGGQIPTVTQTLKLPLNIYNELNTEIHITQYIPHILSNPEYELGSVNSDPFLLTALSNDSIV